MIDFLFGQVDEHWTLPVPCLYHRATRLQVHLLDGAFLHSIIDVRVFTTALTPEQSSGMVFNSKTYGLFLHPDYVSSPLVYIPRAEGDPRFDEGRTFLDKTHAQSVEIATEAAKLTLDCFQKAFQAEECRCVEEAIQVLNQTFRWVVAPSSDPYTILSEHQEFFRKNTRKDEIDEINDWQSFLKEMHRRGVNVRGIRFEFVLDERTDRPRTTIFGVDQAGRTIRMSTLTKPSTANGVMEMGKKGMTSIISTDERGVDLRVHYKSLVQGSYHDRDVIYYDVAMDIVENHDRKEELSAMDSLKYFSDSFARADRRIWDEITKERAFQYAIDKQLNDEFPNKGEDANAAFDAPTSGNGSSAPDGGGHLPPPNSTLDEDFNAFHSRKSQS